MGIVLPVYAHSAPTKNYFQLGFGAQYFGYKEYNDQNVLLDREDGLLPGLAMDVGKIWPEVSGALRLELFDGFVDYDGQTQSGIPITTVTDEQVLVFEALLRLKVKSFAKNNAMLIASLGYREWRRNIRATNITVSLLENYRWKFYTLGVAADIWRYENWIGGIDVRWLRPISPTMSVVIAGFDEATLKLKSRNSVRINFPLQNISGVGRQWTITPYWESWYLGRSADTYLTVNGVTTGSIVHEPRSETNIAGLMISVQL